VITIILSLIPYSLSFYILFHDLKILSLHHFQTIIHFIKLKVKEPHLNGKYKYSRAQQPEQIIKLDLKAFERGVHKVVNPEHNRYIRSFHSLVGSCNYKIRSDSVCDIPGILDKHH
jgi:hypothetical protein